MHSWRVPGGIPKVSVIRVRFLFFIAPFSVEVSEISKENGAEKKQLGQKRKKIIYPVRETHVYNGDDIPGMKLLELKLETLLERMRIFECALLKMHNTIYSDEYSQSAKRRKKINFICCPFFRKQKKHEDL